MSRQDLQVRAAEEQVIKGRDRGTVIAGSDLVRPFRPARTVSNVALFALTILGFSFWYLLAVPFASHRETYWWMGMVHSHPISKAFSLIASTYRPLAQATSWAGFLILDPSIFPTSFFRQLWLQGFVYAMFVVGWWLIYSAATERRALALTSLLAGGVFFSGYVHLFHVYGLSYVPVILMLGSLLQSHASATFERRQSRFLAAALLLSLWHPFATALFTGYFFGDYLRKAPHCGRREHARTLALLMLCLGVMAALVAVLAPGFTKAMGNSDRWAGFLASYRTNEVNLIASGVALLLAQASILSLPLSRGRQAALALVVCGLGGVLILSAIPTLLVWLGIALLKLILTRNWPLCFLMLAAMMLPFGGGIGTPMHGLFAIVVAVYVTAMGWTTLDRSLTFLTPLPVGGAVASLLLVICLVRIGVDLEPLTEVAKPLLAERERTYQLESALAWLHKSDYCGCEVSFVEHSGNPADSVENAINRHHRAPAWITDVRLFWNSVLRCKSQDSTRIAVMTFGNQDLSGARPVHQLEGRYAGRLQVWIAFGSE